MRSPKRAPPVFPAGGIHREHRHLFVRKILQKPEHQLIGQAGLARAAGAGYAQDRRLFSGHLFFKHGAPGFQISVVFQRGPLNQSDGPGHLGRLVRRKLICKPGLSAFAHGVVDGLHEMVDHALKPQLAAVFRGVDLGHPVSLQFPGLLRHDNPAAAAENLDMPATGAVQKIHRVLEKLHVAALIAAYAHRVDILRHRRLHHLGHRTVVTQVDHLHPGHLQNPPYNIDGRVVAVEQTGRRNHSHRVLGYVRLGLHDCFLLMAAGRRGELFREKVSPGLPFKKLYHGPSDFCSRREPKSGDRCSFLWEGAPGEPFLFQKKGLPRLSLVPPPKPGCPGSGRAGVLCTYPGCSFSPETSGGKSTCGPGPRYLWP